MSGMYSAVGRLGQNAEVRQTQNGTSVASMAIAVDVGFGDHKSTLWLDASLWGKRAEGGLIQYLGKGQQVWVAGEIGTRQFQKNDGSQGFAVTLKVAEIDLVGSALQQGGQQQPQRQPPQATQQQPQGGQGNYGAPPASEHNDFDDEIPFN